MSEWQDISSAPQEWGSEILACEVREGTAYYWIVYFVGLDEHGEPEWFDGEVTIHPSHWLPLPPAPEPPPMTDTPLCINCVRLKGDLCLHTRIYVEGYCGPSGRYFTPRRSWWDRVREWLG